MFSSLKFVRPPPYVPLEPSFVAKMVDWSKPSSADKSPVDNSATSSKIVCNRYKKPKPS